MNVIAMLIGFIAVIAGINWCLGEIGHLFDPEFTLSLDWIFGKVFYPMAWAMGVPAQDVGSVATLLGQKLTINEFVAFKNLTAKTVPIVTDKGLLILSIAICGFANFSSPNAAATLRGSASRRSCAARSLRICRRRSPASSSEPRARLRAQGAQVWPIANAGANAHTRPAAAAIAIATRAANGTVDAAARGPASSSGTGRR